MIPEFPKFKPLEITDRDDIIKYTSKFLPYSDFNFTSLWSWNTDDKFLISSLNDNIVIKFLDYITGTPFFSFIGSNKPEDTVNALLRLSHEKIGLNYLRMVPAHSIKEIMNRKDFSILEEKEAFDYIYFLSDIYRYKSGSLKSKRHLVSNFVKKYDDIVVSALDIKDIPTQNAIISIAENSSSSKEGDVCRDSHELVALKRFMELFNLVDQKNIIPLGVYVSGKLIIFNFTEILYNSWAIVHFEKANFSLYPEAGAYIFYELMEMLKESSVQYINLEQDLGINGLRANKMSYRPMGYLKKYKISGL